MAAFCLHLCGAFWTSGWPAWLVDVDHVAADALSFFRRTEAVPAGESIRNMRREGRGSESSEGSEARGNAQRGEIRLTMKGTTMGPEREWRGAIPWVHVLIVADAALPDQRDESLGGRVSRHVVESPSPENDFGRGGSWR